MFDDMKGAVQCKKCESYFTPKLRGRVNCYVCVPESPLDSDDEGIAPPIACSTCKHGIVCSAAYDGFACGREQFRDCKPYTLKKHHERGRPLPEGSAYRTTAPTRPVPLLPA